MTNALGKFPTQREIEPLICTSTAMFPQMQKTDNTTEHNIAWSAQRSAIRNICDRRGKEDYHSVWNEIPFGCLNKEKRPDEIRNASLGRIEKLVVSRVQNSNTGPDIPILKHAESLFKNPITLHKNKAIANGSEPPECIARPMHLNEQPSKSRGEMAVITAR